MDLNKVSVVRWFEDTNKHSCGYCKSENSISQGMWAESLTVDDYQELIDRGWRRSGKYCYKSLMEQTCCPLYTIKCDVINFLLSKSQKKVIKRFNKFLKDGNIKYEDNIQFEEPDNHSDLHQNHPKMNLSDLSASISNSIQQNNLTSIETPSTSNTDEIDLNEMDNSQQKTEKICDKASNSSQLKVNTKTPLKVGVGADPTKPPCKKAKILRIERKKAKGLQFQKSPPVSNQKSLEQFLEEVSQNDKKKLRMCLIPTSVPNSTWKASEDIEFQLYKKYQMVIHNDPPSKLSLDGFDRFLVKSPLKPKQFPEGIDGPGYGSFHQQYWINDRLIAVGVIDILPRCVSSVYFFYDPDYRSLTLGTYGSLREVQLTRYLQKNLPHLSSYYMGFYIHSCPKMRYKGKLTPSYLVCPETYHWVPIEKCITLLEANKYSRLEEDIDAIDENLPTQRDISEIQVVYQRHLMHYDDFDEFGDESEKFKLIANFIGKKCCRSLIFWEQ
ncbi:arginyl-tRNA--protein transferase 1 isoform X1 [Diorhabda carinulata]|uniref:arginyl-tRNA--protein transferase 1 isoform X1 n=1 Tax=Diorhabda carinulata TaxID=1163345 RepID=UPI0025A039BA|nr:arginyl-tRNA--protein transferase 1 isoform X1 [Diorhabda carinulata]